MKLEPLKVYRYKLPLTAPLDVKGIAVKQRGGLFVELNTSNGIAGFGEVSPLPGLHQESFENVVLQLNDVLTNSNVNEMQKRLAMCCESVQFGVETAIFDLKCRVKKGECSSMFGRPKTLQLGLNGFIGLGSRNVSQKVLELLAQGYQTIKVKVAGENIAQDIDRVNEICVTVGQRAKVRVDANQAWDLADAVEFCRSLAKHKIEYVEEPLKDVSKLAKLASMVEQSIALDETIYQGQLNELQSWNDFSHLVIKPSRIGSLERLFDLVKQAHSKNKRCAISSCYESGIGLSFLSFLASFVEGKEVVTGISTADFLAADVLCPPFKPVRGQIDIKACAHNLKEFLPKLKSSEFVERIK